MVTTKYSSGEGNSVPKVLAQKAGSTAESGRKKQAQEGYAIATIAKETT